MDARLCGSQNCQCLASPARQNDKLTWTIFANLKKITEKNRGQCCVHRGSACDPTAHRRGPSQLQDGFIDRLFYSHQLTGFFSVVLRRGPTAKASCGSYVVDLRTLHDVAPHHHPEDLRLQSSTRVRNVRTPCNALLKKPRPPPPRRGGERVLPLSRLFRERRQWRCFLCQTCGCASSTCIWVPPSLMYSALPTLPKLHLNLQTRRLCAYPPPSLTAAFSDTSATGSFTLKIPSACSSTCTLDRTSSSSRTVKPSHLVGSAPPQTWPAALERRVHSRAVAALVILQRVAAVSR